MRSIQNRKSKIQNALLLFMGLCSTLLVLVAGCAYLRPTEYAPVVSRVPAKFRVEGRPVILILMDGCRADVLYDMIDAGKLPNIRKHIADRGVRVERAYTVFPSLTFATISSQLTGKTPAHLNFPNNTWFDRSSQILRVINSSASVTRINTDITGPTIAEIIAKERPFDSAPFGSEPLFEPEPQSRRQGRRQGRPGAWSAIIADTLTRGAQYSDPLREWLGICYFLRRWRLVDRFAMESMHDILVQANWRGTFPAFTFIHLLAPDNMGHMYGPGDDEYREAIYHEDKHIGRLMRTLEQEGLADKVWVALTADHGMKAVEKNQSLDLHKFISHRMNIRCAYEAVEEGTPRPWREAWFRRFRAVETTSGARCCFIYLSNPDNVPQGMGEWTKRPSLESLRKFRTDTDETIDVIAALREQPGVGFICARDAKGDCHVYSSDGHAVIRAKGDGRDAPPGRLYQYTIEEGRDPLGYDLIPKSKVANPKSKDEWFAATCDSEYPNFVPEVYDLFDSPRTGDLVLFAAPGWTFKAGQKGAHGGPHRDELRIPILITGPGIRHGEKIPRARSVDLVPTFLEHMGIKTDAKFDGRSLLEQITLNRPGNHKEVKMRDKR